MIKAANRDQRSLVEIASEDLRMMILKGDLAPGSQLPSEPDLAKALQVSRSTLRASLSSLQLRGLIVRKPGVGTFVTRLELFQNNLNENSDVADLIRATGHEPKLVLLGAQVVRASSDVSMYLDGEAGDSVVEVVRVRTADGRPVVYEEEYFHAELLSDRDPPISVDRFVDLLKQSERLYAVFRDDFCRPVIAGQAWLVPVAADSKLASLLSVPRGAPLLHIRQVDFDREHTPILVSFEYHVCDLCTFSVYRTGGN